MSISDRTLRPRRGHSSWLVPSAKQKQIILLGEIAIFFGVIFLMFGIFMSDVATAGSEVDQGAVVFTDHQMADFALAPPLPEFRADKASLKPEVAFAPDQRNGRDLVGLKGASEAKVPAELTSKLGYEQDVPFVGGRVRANYLLPATKIEWFDAPFIISHYTFALESDPMYANDKKISVPGLPEDVKLREGFVFGGRGIIQQGTGLTEDGEYVSIDWTQSHYDENDVSNNRWVFTFGQGRPVENWKTVAVRHPDLVPGTRIIIQNYGTTREFVVGDAGLDLAENQIDIFVGLMTIEEADELGVQRSKVGIVRPISHFVPDSETESDAAKE